MNNLIRLTTSVMSRHEPRPYTFVSPDFAYSRACTLCRMECEHSKLQHDALRFGVDL